MPAPAPAVQQIDYAPPPPWRKRKAFRRVVRGIVLLGVLAVAVYFAPAVWHRVMLLHAQRRCLSFTGSPDKVVYESDPDRAAALMATDRQYVALRPEGHPVAWFSKDWDRLYALLSPPGRREAATVFMGERRAREGPRRLVVVEMYNVGERGSYPDFTGAVIELGTPLSPPRVRRLIYRYLFYLPKHEKLRLYAAQADAKDESHFTFRYEINGVSGTIDGWLQAEDRVILEVRDGPAKEFLDWLNARPTPSAPSSPE